MDTKPLFMVILFLLASIVGIAAFSVVRTPTIVVDVAKEAAEVAEETIDEVTAVVTNTPASRFEDEDDEDDDDDAEAISTAPIVPTTPAASSGTFTLAQVAQHNTSSDCYTAIKGTVYDLTPFVRAHPGGVSNIVRLCGIEGTAEFAAQHGGDRRPESELASLKIGVLAQ